MNYYFYTNIKTPDNYLLENTKYFDESRHAFVLKPVELRERNLKLNLKPFQDASKQVDKATKLIKGELDIFATTEFKAECCPNTFSSSEGCACMTTEQYGYLKNRGGNNVPYSEY